MACDKCGCPGHFGTVLAQGQWNTGANPTWTGSITVRNAVGPNAVPAGSLPVANVNACNGAADPKAHLSFVEY